MTLNCIMPQIWHLNFSNSYDLALHFFRFQEFYESPSVKKQKIQLIDLMENYSQKNGDGSFTYTKDWAGFNLPAEKIFELHKKGISDKNRYDEMMLGLAKFIRAKEGGSEDFYIIGTSDDDEEKEITFNHELAHGLFFIDEKYKDKTTALVEALPKKTKNFLFKKLRECGYDDDVLIDETQAYMSTGLFDSFDTPAVRKEIEPFVTLFNKHAGRLKKRVKSK